MMNGRIDQVSKRMAAVARSRELNHKQDQLSHQTAVFQQNNGIFLMHLGGGY